MRSMKKRGTLLAETIKNIGANPVETILEAQKLIGRCPNISNETRERYSRESVSCFRGYLNT